MEGSITQERAKRTRSEISHRSSGHVSGDILTGGNDWNRSFHSKNSGVSGVTATETTITLNVQRIRAILDSKKDNELWAKEKPRCKAKFFEQKQICGVTRNFGAHTRNAWLEVKSRHAATEIYLDLGMPGVRESKPSVHKHLDTYGSNGNYQRRLRNLPLERRRLELVGVF